ncbi:MAG: hypothetical protein R2762_14585 [Bryobacteraceae bacterium]
MHRSAQLSTLASFSLLVMAAACTSEPPKPKEKKAPPEMVGGQSAFFKMYGQARVWAQDVQGYQCIPIPLAAHPAADGKWPAWRCQYASAAKGAVKSWSFSIAEEEGIHEGVFGGPEERLNTAGQMQPWPIQALKVDSAAAIETAKDLKEAKAYMAKHPDTPITVELARTKRHPNLRWRVIWGTSASTSNFSVIVDATTGQYVEILH